MTNNGRAFLTLLFAGFLHLLLTSANGALAIVPLSLNADVLFVLFCGLYLRILHGWWMVIAIGLCLDAVRPLPFGASVVGLIFLWVGVVWFRGQMRRDKMAQLIVVAVIPQFFWMVALTLLLAEGRWQYHGFWQRAGLDLLLSLTLVATLAYPWCEIQRTFLRWTGWDLNAEMHRV